jgi:hypothetical protein
MQVNPSENPGQYGWMPNLMVYNPAGPNNNLMYGNFSQPPGVIQQNAVNPPGSNYASTVAPANG